MKTAPDQIWWTVNELFVARLPDLPTTKRGLNDRAKDWRKVPNATKRKPGRGGGFMYHWTVLPVAAQRALMREAGLVADPKPTPTPDWAAFDALPEKAKGVARMRLAVLDEVQTLHAAGQTLVAAVATVSARISKSDRTVFNWLTLVEAVPAEHRLAALAPRHGVVRRKKRVEVDPRFFRVFKSDYLRDKAITFQVAYEHAEEYARREGIKDIPPLHLCRRRYKEQVPKPVEVLYREGPHALKRFYPHQERSRIAMEAMEAVQADYHKLDLFAHWPGEEKPQRPQIVVFSDIFSGKILAWRMSLNPNAETVRLCFGDVVRDYGLPRHALMDNGREFAAKILTGGAPTRYRFKDNDDDMLGLFPQLGIELHWASPGWGQAKPIERAFLDLTRRIPTHPALQGAQTGNNPRAKPKDYGSKAADLDTVRAVVADVIARHNRRADRQTETAFNQSFEAVFNASYKTAVPRVATPEQKRLWLMAAEPVRAKRGNGEIKLYGNRYWSEWMYALANQKVVARFDPDDLHSPVHIYALNGAYQGEAAVLEKGVFFSKEAAAEHERKRSQFTKSVRETGRLHKELTDREIAAKVGTPGAPVAPDELPQADVVRLVPGHEHGPKSPRPSVPVSGGEVAPFQRRDDNPQASDDPEVTDRRYAELVAIEAEGGTLTDAQRTFITEYPKSPAFRARQRVRQAFGEPE